MVGHIYINTELRRGIVLYTHTHAYVYMFDTKQVGESIKYYFLVFGIPRTLCSIVGDIVTHMFLKKRRIYKF